MCPHRLESAYPARSRCMNENECVTAPHGYHLCSPDTFLLGPKSPCGSHRQAVPPKLMPILELQAQQESLPGGPSTGVGARGRPQKCSLSSAGSWALGRRPPPSTLRPRRGGGRQGRGQICSWFQQTVMEAGVLSGLFLSFDGITTVYLR